ncbi:MAG: cobalt ECF transporter T component CbiQ [Anaerolineae bacterium]|jgi:cobalt/nickel transport system permease protein|nr:cobalt ECF transporter T component CbiQ [Anaerolineae bacterium]MDH7473368.1 cobalt ECF transporter T component CbiQ [Anaerolineae bacterium]
MKHSFIDRYSDLDSPIHHLDPRTRILTTLAFVLAVMVTPPTSWLAFTLYASLMAGLVLLAKLPVRYVLKRSAVVLPFVLMVAVFVPFWGRGQVMGSYNVWLWRVSVTHDGLLVLWSVTVKSWLSALALILLSSTTRFSELLKGLEHVGVPRVMVMILAFMYRYIFVLADEVMRMQRARDSRDVAPLRPYGGGWLWQIRTVGNMIGTLFIRSYERAERVYGAMVARGFDGQVRTLNDLHFRRADLGFGIVFSAALLTIGLITRIA